MTPKQIRDAIKKEHSHYQEAVNDLNKRLFERDHNIKAIQRKCKHKNTTSGPEVATTCDDCGKEL